MANNFLRFKVLMLSTASSMEIYTAARGILANIDIRAKAKVDNAEHIELRLYEVSNFDACADVAETKKIRLESHNQSNLQCSVSTGLAIKTKPQMNDELKGEAKARLCNAISIEPRIVGRLNVSCSARLLRHEYKIAVDEKIKSKFSANANVAQVYKTVIEPINSTLDGRAEYKNIQTTKISARMDKHLSLKCTSNIAMPIKCSAVSSSTSDMLAKLGLLNAVNVGINQTNHTDMKCGITLLGRSRLSNFNSTRLSEISGLRISDLKYRFEI